MPPDSTSRSCSSALGLGQPPLATVLLAHELPDGTHHIDWMMARDSKNALPLASFRIVGRLDTLGPGESLAAERIADHRPIYLEYEGAVSANRGHVRRLRSGTIRRWRDASPDAVVLEVAWKCDGGIESDAGCEVEIVQELELRVENSSQWLVKCVSMGRC